MVIEDGEVQTAIDYAHSQSVDRVFIIQQGEANRVRTLRECLASHTH